MRVAQIKIMLFALILAIPVLSLLLFGVVDAFGRDHPDFPRLGQALRGKKHRLDQFGDAVLDRSAATFVAVKLRGWIGYRIVGFVDAPRIVSGEDGWLFYRAEFKAGDCRDPDHIAQRLRGLAALIDLGRASGLDLIMSVSPDKSSVYPEMLSGFSHRYWKCRLQNTATLQRLLKQEAPLMLDHAVPLLAQKVRYPDMPLYYKTDTHWTPYGGTVALRQLLAAIFPGAAVPEARPAGIERATRTDLGRMLLQDIEYDIATTDLSPERDLRPLNRDPAGFRTAIAHDSFYGKIWPQFVAIFPDAVNVSLDNNGERAASEMMEADRFIINLVERSFVHHIDRGVVAWDAPMMVAIVERNRQRAQSCRGFNPIRVTDIANDGEGADTPAGARGEQIDIPRVAPDRLPCLRLSLTAAKPGVVEFALPNPATGAFEPGRAFKYQIAPGSQTVGFVLPAYVAGPGVRVDIAGLGKSATLSAIEVGEIERPHLTSSIP